MPRTGSSASGILKAPAVRCRMSGMRVGRMMRMGMEVKREVGGWLGRRRVRLEGKLVRKRGWWMGEWGGVWGGVGVWGENLG